MNKIHLYISMILLACTAFACQEDQSELQSNERPNILLVISDDQSYPYAGAYGYEGINTPGFDRIAREGVLFNNAFAASPGCSPSRAALLTGRNCWQIEAAGTHASYFPTKYPSYPELLKQAGYSVGYTGKGWGPGNYQISGREENPAGKAWQELTMEAPEGINSRDYASNFQAFLDKKPDDQPFCFWLGTHEPHRKFKKGIGLENGKKLEDAQVPAFLPDTDEIRSDILDYLYEIEWFDQHLEKAINLLEERGELDNTLIIVTSDNGMAFPRAKANLYEYGFHVPFAVRFGNNIKEGRAVNDLVGFTDVAPTILEACGVEHPGDFPMSGKSFLDILNDNKDASQRLAVFGSRERHSSVRYRSLAYPQRAIRTQDHLLVWNIKPERWPAGAPQKYGSGNYPTTEEVKNLELGPEDGGYHDIDACPSLDFLIENKKEYGDYLDWAVAHRPEFELFNINEDPDCLDNLAEDPGSKALLNDMKKQLMEYLGSTEDFRLGENGDIWETYPRFSRLRAFPVPEWAEKNPDAVPEMKWLEEHWQKQLGSE